MSENDQITVIVCLEYLWPVPVINLLKATIVLGYQPDRLELRYSRDEVDIVYQCLRNGWHGYSKELYESWSKDWVYCAEPERSEQKQKLHTKTEEITCAMRESTERELAAGKTTASYVDKQRHCDELNWKLFWEYKEKQAQVFILSQSDSNAARLGRKGTIKWLKPWKMGEWSRTS